MGLTNLELVKFCKGMVGQPYWYGTVCYPATKSLLERKTKQYPSHYTSSRMSKYKTHIGQKRVVTDCVGLNLI